MVLFRPLPGLLWGILIWKVACELLYPIAGGTLDIFEFIERWGDYGIPVAMLTIAAWERRTLS